MNEQQNFLLESCYYENVDLSFPLFLMAFSFFILFSFLKVILSPCIIELDGHLPSHLVHHL